MLGPWMARSSSSSSPWPSCWPSPSRSRPPADGRSRRSAGSPRRASPATSRRAGSAACWPRPMPRRSSSTAPGATSRISSRSSGSASCGIGDDRRITSANAAAHTLLDRPTGSLRGLTITGAFLDARIDAIVETARETGAASGEVRLRPDAAMLVVRARRSPVEGLWLVLEDVSELRRLQQIRAEFIDNLSHELRTPLTTVSLLAETLTREAEAAGDAIPGRMRDRIAQDRGRDGPHRPDGQRAPRPVADRERRQPRRPRLGRHGPARRRVHASACACSPNGRA